MLGQWEIATRIAASIFGTQTRSLPTSTLVFYALALTAIAAYTQILRDINDELRGC